MNLRSKIFQRRIIGLLLILLAAGLLLLILIFSRSKEKSAAPAETAVSQSQAGRPTAKNLFQSLFSLRSATPVETATAWMEATGTPTMRPTRVQNVKTETPTVEPSDTQGGSNVDSGGMFYFPTEDGSLYSPTPTLYVIYRTPPPTWTQAPSSTPPKTPTPKPTSTLKYPRTATVTPTLNPAQSATPSSTATVTATRTVTPTATATQPERQQLTATTTSTQTLPGTGMLAFLSPGGEGSPTQVRLFNFAGKTSSKLVELANVELCSWSPDGTHLLLQVKRENTEITDLQLLALDGTLTTITGSLNGSSRCGDWLPDGTAILFPYTNEAGITSLSSWTLRTNERQELYTSGYGVSEPDVSPDGRWVVFTVGDGSPRYLVLLDLVNHSAERLTFSAADEDSPRFSADSQSVIFSRFVDQSWDLYSVSLVAKTETCLTNNPANELWPEVSADGRYLLFSSDAAGALNVYLLPKGGTVPMRVLPEETVQAHPLWRP